MLRRLSLFILIVSTLFSCNLSNEPQFNGIENIRILSIKNAKFIIGGDVMFLNTNDIGCNVVKTDILAYVNGIEVGKVNQKQLINLKANKEFKLPILFSFTPQDIVKDKKSIFDGAISALVNRTVDILFKGSVTLNKLGVTFDIDVESEDKIKIK